MSKCYGGCHQLGSEAQKLQDSEAGRALCTLAWTTVTLLVNYLTGQEVDNAALSAPVEEGTCTASVPTRNVLEDASNAEGPRSPAQGGPSSDQDLVLAAGADMSGNGAGRSDGATMATTLLHAESVERFDSESSPEGPLSLTSRVVSSWDSATSKQTRLDSLTKPSEELEEPACPDEPAPQQGLKSADVLARTYVALRLEAETEAGESSAEYICCCPVCLMIARSMLLPCCGPATVC